MLLTRRISAFGIALFTVAALTAAPQAKLHSGTVLESMNGGGYSYINVQEGDESYWIAAPQTAVKKGDSISFNEQMWMPDFTSKTLKRTFDRIMFVGSVKGGSATKSAANLGPMAFPKPFPKPYPEADATPQNVEDAGLFTVADLYAQKDKLNGKRVSVEGKVVKVSKSIMGKNWIHVSDGTGSGKTAKIIFTSPGGLAAVGDEVTAIGILETNLDVGAGYFYDVIVQSSTFRK